MAKTFTLKIDLENAAFGEYPESEVCRILEAVLTKIELGDWYPGHSKTILDVNGNDVGRWKFSAGVKSAP